MAVILLMSTSIIIRNNFSFLFTFCVSLSLSIYLFPSSSICYLIYICTDYACLTASSLFACESIGFLFFWLRSLSLFSFALRFDSIGNSAKFPFIIHKENVNKNEISDNKSVQRMQKSIRFHSLIKRYIGRPIFSVAFKSNLMNVKREKKKHLISKNWDHIL